MSKKVKSIEEILLLTDKGYAEYIDSLAKEEDVYWVLDELDDWLLKIVEQQPEKVGRICRINSTAFEKLPEKDLRLHLISYNFNTRLIAAICGGKVSEAKDFFRDGIEHCRKHKHYEAGKSICQNVFGIWKLAAMPSDEALHFLMLIKEFYEELSPKTLSTRLTCGQNL